MKYPWVYAINGSVGGRISDMTIGNFVSIWKMKQNATSNRAITWDVTCNDIVSSHVVSYNLWWCSPFCQCKSKVRAWIAHADHHIPAHQISAPSPAKQLRQWARLHLTAIAELHGRNYTSRWRLCTFLLCGKHKRGQWGCGGRPSNNCFDCCLTPPTKPCQFHSWIWVEHGSKSTEEKCYNYYHYMDEMLI